MKAQSGVCRSWSGHTARELRRRESSGGLSFSSPLAIAGNTWFPWKWLWRTPLGSFDTEEGGKVTVKGRRCLGFRRVA